MVVKKKTKRLAAYVRVSHDEQWKFGFSIDTQIDKIKEYAEKEGYQIVDFYIDEGYTATKMKRPALLKMLDELRLFDIVVFTRLDRFSRNVLQANKMVEILDEYNVAIKSIEEEDIDTSTADGRFNFNLRVSLAQREAEKTSERIKSVFEFKVKAGQPITGNQPYGYIIETKDEKKSVIKDPNTKHIIEDIFSYFAKHHTIRKTMLYINEKYNLDKSYNSIARILSIPEYYGEYEENPNYYDPYITKEEYERNQSRIKAHIKHGRHKHTYLFTSLLFCPKCGLKMTGKYVKRKNKNGTVVEYYNYVCGLYQKEKKCTFDKCINENNILEYLMNNVEELAKKHIAEVLEFKPTKEVVSSEQKIKEILEEMDSINYMFQKKRMDKKKYDREFEALEKELANLQHEQPVSKDITILEEFLSSDWKDIYHSLTKENKRALWRNLIKEIRFKEDYSLEVIFL